MLVNNKNDLTLYDYWDLNNISIPSRSRLFSLEPIGIGTPYVESLSSYLTRLAEVHTLLLGDLVAKEIKPILPTKYKSRDLFCTKHPNATVNSIGIIAQYLFTALSELTLREDLESLTLLKWSNVFTPKNLIHPVKKWCPVCYQEQYQEKKIVYDQLLWSFKVLKICPLHSTVLVDQCPNCHQQLPSLARNSRSGYCSNCNQWLGLTCENQISNEQEQWNYWVAHNLAIVVAHNPNIKDIIPKEKISESFSFCLKQMSDNNITVFSHLIKFPKHQVWEWSQGKVVPQLNVLLKVCHLTGVSLLDFLIKKEFSTSYSMKNQSLVNKKINQKKNQSIDWLALETNLKNISSNPPIPPPSMVEVSKKIGYHRRTLTRRFPQLCQRISSNYLEYKKENRRQQIKKYCEKVEETVIKLYAQGVYPSESNVCKVLSKSGNFRDPEVRKAFKKARRNLGIR